MTKKRRLLTGVKGVNWAASVPGMIQDWKDLREKAGKVAPAVSLAGSAAPLWWSGVRARIMDSAAWGDAGLIAVVVLAWICAGFLLVRFAMREKAKARGAAQGAKKKARASEQARRMVRRTWGISNDERVSPEKAVEIIRHEHVARVLVEEFIDRHPDACPVGDGKIELDRARLLAWLVRSSTQRPVAPKPLKNLEK